VKVDIVVLFMTLMEKLSGFTIEYVVVCVFFMTVFFYSFSYVSVMLKKFPFILSLLNKLRGSIEFCFILHPAVLCWLVVYVEPSLVFWEETPLGFILGIFLLICLWIQSKVLYLRFYIVTYKGHWVVVFLYRLTSPLVPG
jgi:hypothetical protein